MRTGLLLVVALSLIGCASSPATHFFTLHAIPAAENRQPALPAPVQIAAVHLPPSLDRRQMVRMTSASGVAISESDRWSGPLDDMVRNVLSEDLLTRLPAGRVVLPAAPAPEDTRAIVVTVADFGPDPSGAVTLTGSWALLDRARQRPTFDRQFALSVGSAATPEGMAAGMSRALAQLADRIASALVSDRAALAPAP